MRCRSGDAELDGNATLDRHNPPSGPSGSGDMGVGQDDRRGVVGIVEDLVVGWHETGAGTETLPTSEVAGEQRMGTAGDLYPQPTPGAELDADRPHPDPDPDDAVAGV
jgi:hypothetical protein